MDAQRMEAISIPKWLWAVLLAATAWAFHLSVEVHTIRAGQTQILDEHDRRILKLEDRVESLTDRLFRLEGAG
jgi:hypothetical protein